MTPIARYKTRHGDIVVLRNRSHIAYWQDDRHQSQADKHGVSLAGYIHAIHCLLHQARCRDVLMIGCGGGTLATMLRAGGVGVTIVEINELSFAISRKYFGLPDEVECQVADGRDFLRDGEKKFDAIVLDVYDGDDIPSQLRTVEFFELVRARLHESGGCFFANVIMRNERDRRLDELVCSMRRIWPLVRVLGSPGASVRNAIAMAGEVGGLERPTLRMRPMTGSKGLARKLRAMSFVSYLTEQRQRLRPRPVPLVAGRVA